MRKLSGVIAAFVLFLTLASCGGSTSSNKHPGGGVVPGNGGTGNEFVYVANRNAGTITSYHIGSDGKLTFTAHSTVAAQAGGLAGDGRDRVYSSGAFEIDGFSVNTDGSLNRLGTWTGTDPEGAVAPSLLTMLPGGTRMYAHILDPTEGIETFNIAPDGSLSAMNAYTAIGVGKIEFTSDAQTAYLPTSFQLNSGISWLSRDATTGALSLAGTFSFPQPVGLGRVAISPNGEFVAETLSGGQLAMFMVDQATRALTPVSGMPFGMGGAFGGIAWSANGEFVLVASDTGVRVFNIDSSGQASEVNGQPGPGGMTNVLATGGNVVIATSASAGTISSYRLDPNSGMLTAVTTSKVSGAGAGEMTVLSH